MKRYALFAGASVICAALMAQAQTGGSGATGTTGANTGTASGGNTSSTQSSTSGNVSGGNGTHVQSSTSGQTTVSNLNAPTGTVSQAAKKLPPGITYTNQLPGLVVKTNNLNGTSNAIAGTTNQPAGLVPANEVGAAGQLAATNQFGSISNNIGISRNAGISNNVAVSNTVSNSAGISNNTGVSNNVALMPTGRLNATNRQYGTNRGYFGGANKQNMSEMQDQAFTAEDRTLLLTLRERVMPELRRPSGAWAPVHFSVREGVVTIIGIVETKEMKQRLETICSQTPGIARVIDRLRVGSAYGGAAATETDSTILSRVRETVLPQVPTISPGTSVNFAVENGVVSVMGVAPTLAGKQRVEALVRQVPGVADVTDQMTVNIPLVP